MLKNWNLEREKIMTAIATATDPSAESNRSAHSAYAVRSWFLIHDIDDLKYLPSTCVNEFSFARHVPKVKCERNLQKDKRNGGKCAYTGCVA